MASDRVLLIGEYANWVIKGAIGLGLAIAGWHFKELKTDIKQSLMKEHELDNRLSIVETVSITVAKQLDRMEGKMDRVLEKTR